MKTSKCPADVLLGFVEEVKSRYCVKSAQIRSFFWSVFPRIRTEYWKIRTRKNSVFGYFSRSVRKAHYSRKAPEQHRNSTSELRAKLLKEKKRCKHGKGSCQYVSGTVAIRS